MLAAAVVDPLLSSPARARRHDDDMAALRRLPALELPPSVAAVASSYSDGDEAAADSSDGFGDDEDEAGDAFEQRMNRGNYLRRLRLLALADEEERRAQECADAPAEEADYGHFEEKKEDDDDLYVPRAEDRIYALSDGARVLDYDSYLSHQRYHDDLKHSDVDYVDFGEVCDSWGDSGGRLVIEQRKSLGKGGLIWDAAFVLAEHVIANEAEWTSVSCGERRRPQVLELGAGTGICGLTIAKAVRCDVEVTDLPELEGLMIDNVRRNFRASSSSHNGSDDDDLVPPEIDARDGLAKGAVASRVLRWGVPSDYGRTPYDVLLGADVVTSLYDPAALARTLRDLSGPTTKVYLSGKARLDKPHDEFDREMRRWFDRYERAEPVGRMKSPGVFVIVAEGKR
ncbi:hypothetical protein ACHAWF_003499 [Thalassiosira exigua]